MTRTAPAPAGRTAAMSAEELARVVASVHGWTQDGGWLFAGDVPVAQGYAALGRKLERLGLIRVGAGIDWRPLDATPAQRIRRTAA